MTVPCWHCPQRQLGCHATCKEYMAFSAAQAALIEKRQAEAELRGIFWNGVSRSLEQERRGKRRARKRKARER